MPLQRPGYIDEEEWRSMPERIEVRITHVRVDVKGFRTRELWISSTLLDPIACPAERIARL